MKNNSYIIIIILLLAYCDLRGEISINPQLDCLCGNTPTQAFQLVADGSAGPFTFEWVGPEGYTSSEQNPEDISLAGSYSVFVFNSFGCPTAFNIQMPSCVSIELESQVQGACSNENNGSISLNNIVNSEDLSFAWSTGDHTSSITNLSAGEYTLSITDNTGCSLIQSYIVPNYPELQLSEQFITNGCNSNTASIDVSITGGTPPYSFLWNTGATSEDVFDLPASEYSLSVTDGNNCTVTQIFEIELNNNLILSNSIINTSCSESMDGSATLTIQGGVAPYYFALNNGDNNFSGIFNNLSTGNYCVTVTDAQDCNTIDCFDVSANTSLNIAATLSNDCDFSGEGSIDISISGGQAPYTIDWLDIEGLENPEDRSALNFGTYSVSITDFNACTVEETFTVHNNLSPNISAEITPVTCTATNDGIIALNVNGNSAPSNYSYTWVDSAGNTINSPQGHILEGLAPGNYCVTVSTNSLECTTEDCYSVPISTNIEAPYLKKIQIYTVEGELHTLIYEAEWVPSFSDCMVFTGGTLNITDELFSKLENNEVGLEIIAKSNKPLEYLNATLPGIENSLTPGFSIGPLEFKINFAANSLQNLITSQSLDQAILFSGATPAPESFQLLNMWAMSDELADCVYIPTLQEDCSWNHSPIFSGEDPTHTLYRPCKDMALSVAYQTNQVYLNPSPVAYEAINWTTPDGIYSNVTSVNLNSPGEYCAEIVFNQNCTVELCEYICPPQNVDEIDANVEVLSSCASLGSGSICFKTEPLEEYDFTLISAPPGFIIDVEIGPTFLCYRNVLPGSYSFLLFNLPCGNAFTYTIEVPVESSPIDVRIQSQISSCIIDGVDQQDGSLCLEVEGGVPPYEYDWLNMNSNSECISELDNESTYTLIITDYCGTEYSQTFSLPEYVPPSIAGYNIGNTCGNTNTGFIELDISGDVADEDIIWIGSIIPCPDGRCGSNIYDLSAGTYMALITDRCGNIVDPIPSFTVGTTPSEQIISVLDEEITHNCENSINTGAIDLTLNTSNLNFQWSNGAQTEDIIDLDAGTYNVTITNEEGCSITKTYTINTIFSEITPSITHSCLGGQTGAIQLNISGNDPPYQVLWSDGSTQTNLDNLATGTYHATITSHTGCTFSESYVITSSNNINISLENLENVELDPNTGASSSSGSITISVEGGTAPYLVNWSNGASGFTNSNLGQGIYTAFITDANGCTANQSFYISPCNADILLLSIPIQNINTCVQSTSGDAIYTGSIDLNVSGGSPPYTYMWSGPPGFSSTFQDLTNLTQEGLYCVTVTDNCGITSQLCQELVCNCLLNATFAVEDPCFNTNFEPTSIELISFGGDFGSTLLLEWSTGETGLVEKVYNLGTVYQVINGTKKISGLEPGNYDVTLTDQVGCSKVETFYLSNNEVPTVQLAGSNMGELLDYYDPSFNLVYNECISFTQCGDYSETTYNNYTYSSLEFVPNQPNAPNPCALGGILNCFSGSTSWTIPINESSTLIQDENSCACFFPAGIIQGVYEPVYVNLNCQETQSEDPPNGITCNCDACIFEDNYDCTYTMVCAETGEELASDIPGLTNLCKYTTASGTCDLLNICSSDPCLVLDIEAIDIDCDLPGIDNCPACISEGALINSLRQTNTNTHLPSTQQLLNTSITQNKKLIEKQLVIDNVYPNPFTNKVFIDLYSPDQQNIQFKVIDILGKQVFDTNYDVFEGSNTIQLSFNQDFPDGLYTLIIKEERGETLIYKLAHIQY